MIQKETLKFLKELKKNNNRPWFEKHRPDYETAKSGFLMFTGQVIKSISSFDPPIGNLAAKDCVFRINRDVRFSKDKSPYKTNLAAYFNREGKKGNGAGYYLHLEPGKSFAAGGIWMPLPPQLAGIRQEIDYCFEEWNKLTGSPAFRKNFPGGLDHSDVLLRPPKGYEDSNPAIDFLKMKSFIVRRPFTDSALQQKDFLRSLSSTFRAMYPMLGFLNRAIT
jgi:uncharacterized protein (TIGR02453 family)